jgi:hypothetical protein
LQTCNLGLGFSNGNEQLVCVSFQLFGKVLLRLKK